MKLPEPQREGGMSLACALQERFSLRIFADAPLSLAEAGQVLWAAQGFTSPDGHRAAPSAGATYPLEAYLMAGGIEGLAAGVYRYDPKAHALAQVAAGDRRAAAAAAALDQESVGRCAAAVVLAGVVGRIAPKYGERAPYYMALEAGHVAQNVLLQAVALGFGGVVIGAFDEAALGRAVGTATGEEVLYMIALGRPRA